MGGDSESSAPAVPPDQPMPQVHIAERGIVVQGLRLATAMSDAPRALLRHAPPLAPPAGGGAPSLSRRPAAGQPRAGGAGHSAPPAGAGRAGSPRRPPAPGRARPRPHAPPAALAGGGAARPGGRGAPPAPAVTAADA